MTHSLYIIGGPGSGKSTLMAKVLEDWDPGPYKRLSERELFGHYLLDDNLDVGVYLGRLRPEYPGTDALSLSVAPHALRWLESLEPRLSWVFGEGARLAHPSFLEALSLHTTLTVVHLTVDPALAKQRRATRPGKPLSDTFCKTITTKAANTATWCEEVGIRLLELDGEADVEDIVADLDEVGYARQYRASVAHPQDHPKETAP